jgi:hypothetical protein
MIDELFSDTSRTPSETKELLEDIIAYIEDMTVAL